MHRFLLMTAAVLMVGWFAPTSVIGADNASDIPGVPLPGTVASGQLGGPIYDVVYRVVVPAGSVILAALSGTSGTDFDLYLFDGSATSVVSKVGLLTSSTGPTSTESVSWPTRIGGTFYVDLNGATNVEGTFTLTVQVVPDPTPPMVSLTLGGGRALTSSRTVSLVVNGFDDLSGVSQMSFSDDGQDWTPWEPYATTKVWDLGATDGTRTVWCRVQNGVGLVSSPARLVVVLDTVPPHVTWLSPSPGTSVTAARPTFSVRFDEPIDAASWFSGGLVIQDPTGAVVPGAYGFAPAVIAGSFTPSQPLTPGVVYIVTVARVHDEAGNDIGPVPSWTIKRVIPTSLSLAVSSTVVQYGAQVSFTTHASLPPGESATLEERTAGTVVFSPVTDSPVIAGLASVRLSPQFSATYRLDYPGSAVATSRMSTEVRVLVRRAVSIAGRGPAFLRTGVVSRSIPIVARVAPAGSTPVVFVASRYDPSRGRYREMSRFVRVTDAAGRATLRWTPSSGLWSWRVLVPPSALFANNASALYRWLIAR